MHGNRVVADASAVAALLFGEPGGPGVAERLEGSLLYAPTLLRYELASVCFKKGSADSSIRTDLGAALRLFPRLQIREVQVPPDALLDVATASGLTAYDAAYVWLSRALEAELVSLDHRLNTAAGSPDWEAYRRG
jgi:predicted nucleic acid-binding protein